jgi:DnaJ-class molecular chaperone
MAGESDARRECPPCRGTGSVISSEGGTAHSVTCPWCDGTGVVPAVTRRPE